MSPTLFAVHLSDGVVTWPWILGGFAVAIPMLVFASFRIRDEEIPRIGMLSAAIFIGSQIHFHLGVTSVHLLLNGLDDIGLTMKDDALIRAWQAADRLRRPWAWPAATPSAATTAPA